MEGRKVSEYGRRKRRERERETRGRREKERPDSPNVCRRERNRVVETISGEEDEAVSVRTGPGREGLGRLELADMSGLLLGKNARYDAGVVDSDFE